ncbi:Ger(x)C family spore germination protein [Paenibacillus glycinis]|uniref:Ger(X)C family spore germination protein n=1 Tax=Paenibacillus glycinis TaxID=2697035 RepID=A0ABW9XMU4_9BACL|nr:Ger(x)C family spore germination protein [Paenibacillus glycinis]NBD23729.1 Ger(x)C family spore germination protein [Paenibacillus glycinis]
MKAFLHIVLLSALLLTSGCWDRTEINDLAFISGSAFDLTDDGEYLLSLQIAVPTSGLGGPGNGGGNQQGKFFVLSATGKDANEAFLKIQNKSSRRLFTSHRSVIFIGESLGKHGIGDLLDVFNHDPRQRLRTYIMMVKGGQGREVLETKYPFEQVPVEAIKEMEMLKSELAVTLRDFFIASSSDGISPVMGVIEAVDDLQGTKAKHSKKNLFQLSGLAILKELKVVGVLDNPETNGFMWMTDRMKSGRVDAYLPEGGGLVGMMVYHAERKIDLAVDGTDVKVKIKLRGQGSLIENNTPLDVSRPKNLELAQRALEASVEKQVRDALFKIQKKCKTDSLGLGQEIYRNRPKQWKSLKRQWDTVFPRVDVTVDAELSLNGAGMGGSPLYLNEKEIRK